MAGPVRAPHLRQYRMPVKGPNGRPGNLTRNLATTLQRDGSGVFVVRVQHDAGCPAVPNGPLDACTCEVVNVEVREA